MLLAAPCVSLHALSVPASGLVWQGRDSGKAKVLQLKD